MRKILFGLSVILFSDICLSHTCEMNQLEEMYDLTKNALSTVQAPLVTKKKPDCRTSYSTTSFYSESKFRDKVSCLKKYVVESLNLAIESGSLKKSVREDTERLVSRLTNVNEILFLESVGCGGGALAFVSANPSATNNLASTISFCPNILQKYQRAFLVKHNQEQVEDNVDTLLINILVHEGLHLVGYKHSKELYKTIYNVVSAIGLPSIHKKNGNQSKWLESLFAKAEDGSILMSKEQ